MSNLQELRNQVLEAKKKAAEAAKSKVEETKLQRELVYLTSSHAIENETHVLINEEMTSTLNDKIEQVKAIYDQAKMTNTKAVYRNNFDYTYNHHVALVYNLLVNTQYAPRSVKDLVKATTNLSDDLVEETLEAFGNLPYYSVVNKAVVEGNKADVDKLKSLLNVVNSRMNLSIDLNKVNQKVFNKAYERAMRKAYDTELEMMKTSELEDNTEFSLD